MRTAVFALAKDEDNYLKEWVNYTVSVGFDDVYVIQNNWRYNRNDIPNTNVYFLEYDGKTVQVRCYTDMLNKYHKEYDFIAFIDIDEFVHIKNGVKINDFLNDYANDDLIYLNWRVFGDNNLDFVEDGNYSVLQRFTKCDDKLWPLGKLLINTKKIGNNIKFNNPHIILSKCGSVMEYTTPSHNKFKAPWCMRPDDMYNFPIQNAELWHFRNKTYQECYDRKFGKEDIYFDISQSGCASDMDYFNREFQNYNRNTISVRDIL